MGELVQIDTKKRVSSAAKKLAERGCKFCPSNKKEGITKVKGKVYGDRKLFIFGMAPGPDENEEGKEFVGRSGVFLWRELKRVGIKREDCEVQNTVRCFPADELEGRLRMRDPSKEEIHCCSLYTEQALAASTAKIYIILGNLAAKAVLGKEFKKTRRIFWSEKLQAKVYCLYHPSYFVRGMYPKMHLKEFRDALDAVAKDLGSKVSKYSFLEEMDYQALTKPSEVRKLYKRLRKLGRRGVRVAVDLEDDVIGGVKQDLCIGFSWKPGTGYCVITGHPRVEKVDGSWRGLPNAFVKKNRRIVSKILADASVLKIFHHGSYDLPSFKDHYGIDVVGYDYDTEYAEYLKYPDRRAFGLAAIATARFPQFGEYKNIIMPEAFPKDVPEEVLKAWHIDKTNPEHIPQMYQYVKKTGSTRLSQLPLKKLVTYNLADCDMTKRIELTTKKDVNLTLLNIYKDAAFILAKMEPNGPAFDFQHHAKLEKLYPPKLESTLDQIKQIAGAKGVVKQLNKKTNEKEKKELWNVSEGKPFNPNSPVQVKALLYQILKIKVPQEFCVDKRGNSIEPGTGKIILEVLGRQHAIARLIQEYRRLSKIVSTYLGSYVECAKANGGLLRTSWFLTGTRTGRLSSGGGKSDESGQTKQINLQNIHGDENLQNQIAADANWRNAYHAIGKAIKKTVGISLLSKIDDVQAAILRTIDKAKKKILEKEIEKLGKTLAEKLEKSLRYKKLIRKLLVGVLGGIMVLLGFDQGQVEVRMVAQASGDKRLIEDCKSTDIHSMVGHRMTGWPIDKIKNDKKTRTLTKNIHFGILFGLGVKGLVAFIKAKDPDSDLTEERAQELVDNYFRRYKKVARYIEKMRVFAQEHGYVETVFGFRRPLSVPDENSENNDEYIEGGESGGGAFWANMAVNSPIQGGAHTLMLMAMAMMHRRPSKYGALIPTLEVHDYMGFKVPIRDIFEMFALGKELLEREPLRFIKKYYPKINWMVPLVVEGKVGFRYGDSIEAYKNDKPKTMTRVLTEMFLETYISESKLEHELKAAA